MKTNENDTIIKKKREMKEPNTLVLLFIMILICSALTYILPAGSFDRIIDPNTNREVVVAGTYHLVERNPISFFDIFKSIPKGMEHAQSIIFFALIIGGAFRIINATGTIERSLGAVVKKMSGRETLIIPVLMLVFSLAGATLGIAEETLVFIPMVVGLCLALGFDSLTGTAILLCGAGAGFAGGMLNPYTIGVAHGITGLPMFSGLRFRSIVFVVLVIVTIIYIMIYAEKIKKHPELSSMYEIDKVTIKKEKIEELANTQENMTNKQIGVLITLLIGMGVIVVGVLKLGFYMTELGAVFLIVGITSGFVGGLKIGQIADEFVLGAKDLLYAALIVGTARAMLVVLESGNIIDTVVNGMLSLINKFPSTLSAYLIFIIQSFVSVIIPSGSGQAAVTIPIIAPVADLVGITRQTTVLTFQFADAFSNIMTPTSGYFMAAIAMSGIAWKKWVKFFFPLFCIWNVIALIFISIAVAINLGPF